VICFVNILIFVTRFIGNYSKNHDGFIITLQSNSLFYQMKCFMRNQFLFVFFFVILAFARKHSASLNFCFPISKLFIQRYTAFIIRLNNLSFQVPVFVNGFPLFDLAFFSVLI